MLLVTCRGALEVVDPRWIEMDGLKSDQLIDLAVGRSREGHSLCICSRFMSAPGFNDISYCSHPDGDVHTGPLSKYA